MQELLRNPKEIILTTPGLFSGKKLKRFDKSAIDEVVETIEMVQDGFVDISCYWIHTNDQDEIVRVDPHTASGRNWDEYDWILEYCKGTDKVTISTFHSGTRKMRMYNEGNRPSKFGKPFGATDYTILEIEDKKVLSFATLYEGVHPIHLPNPFVEIVILKEH